MTQKKTFMPQSQGGLTRFDQDSGRWKIKPVHVVILVVLVALFVLLLHAVGDSIFL